MLNSREAQRKNIRYQVKQTLKIGMPHFGVKIILHHAENRIFSEQPSRTAIE